MSSADKIIRQRREALLKQKIAVSETVLTRFINQAKVTGKPEDFVLAVAAGIERFPKMAIDGSKPLRGLHQLLKIVPPGNSLEYRRSAYLLEFDQVIWRQQTDKDPNRALRGALMAAYPKDPFVWSAAAKEIQYTSEYGGGEDALKIAAWWDRWESNPSFPDEWAAYARMRAWVGVALYTHRTEDAQKAEQRYAAWIKFPDAPKRMVDAFGGVIKYVKEGGKSKP